MARKPPPHPALAPPPLLDDEPTDIGFGLPSDPEEDEDGPPDWDEDKTHPGHPHDQDLFEDSSVSATRVVLDPAMQTTGRFRTTAAPEVSQGRWRERAFVPRGVLPREQLVAGIEEAVTLAAMQRGEAAVVRTALKAQLLPLLQQAVEQAGGDGLDAHLMRSSTATARAAKDPLVGQLVAQMARVSQAAGPRAWVDEAAKLAGIVRQALASPAPRRLSLRRLEQDFEGRIDVEALLSILFSSDTELEARNRQVAGTLENLRLQLRGLSGASQGLMANFTRLKLEKRVLEAERSRRQTGR